MKRLAILVSTAVLLAGRPAARSSAGQVASRPSPDPQSYTTATTAILVDVVVRDQGQAGHRPDGRRLRAVRGRRRPEDRLLHARVARRRHRRQREVERPGKPPSPSCAAGSGRRHRQRGRRPTRRPPPSSSIAWRKSRSGCARRRRSSTCRCPATRTCASASSRPSRASGSCSLHHDRSPSARAVSKIMPAGTSARTSSRRERRDEMHGSARAAPEQAAQMQARAGGRGAALAANGAQMGQTETELRLLEMERTMITASTDRPRSRGYDTTWSLFASSSRSPNCRAARRSSSSPRACRCRRC